MCVILPNFIKIGQTVAEIWRFNGAVKGHILHQRTKFYKDRPNRYGDIAIFVIFQDGGRRYLDFQKFEILTADPLQEANLRHFTKSYQNRSQTVAEI